MANLATACSSSGTFTGVSASTKCLVPPGLDAVYYANLSDLDLTAMALVANFSVATPCGSITNFIMQSSALFKLLEHDGLSSTYTRTRSGAKYVHTITLAYLGGDNTRDCQLKNLESLMCNAVFVISTNGCFNKAIGIKASINGPTVVLSKDKADRKVTQNDFDAKTQDSDESATTVFTFTFTTTEPGLAVGATSIPT